MLDKSVTGTDIMTWLSQFKRQFPYTLLKDFREKTRHEVDMENLSFIKYI